MANSKARLGDRLVLLAIANHADAHGRAAWPSVGTIATESLMSDRQVQRAIKRLLEGAELEVDDGAGPYGVHRYSIPMDVDRLISRPKPPLIGLARPEDRVKRQVSRTKVLDAYTRSNGVCHWCGLALASNAFHVDHIIPICDGGTNDDANLVAACPACNWERAAELHRRGDISGDDKLSPVTNGERAGDNSGAQNVTQTIQDIKPPLKPKDAREARLATRKEFEEWYQDWPHKVGRHAAELSFAKARRSAELAELKAAAQRYVANKPPDRPWCNPATWLNQERWLDEPALTGDPLEDKPTAPPPPPLQLAG